MYKKIILTVAMLSSITHEVAAYRLSSADWKLIKEIGAGIVSSIVSVGAILTAQKLMSIAQGYYKFPLIRNMKDRFADVAGNYEAKANLEELVDFLKNPEKYSHLGTKVPKGMLMYGPPGTGKTLLARALAGEANCSFIQANGSDFAEMYIGVAEQHIRTLFAKARGNGPCIIFIDEIDTIGKKRGSTRSAYQDNILNQLLVEMDGFKQNDKPVIVIAATNRKDILDPALLRAGRFDRDVYVGAPNLKARKEILQIHLNKVKAQGDIDIDRIAKGTPGFVGADLENLVNEAAFTAVRNNNGVITMDDFESALDKISIGSPMVECEMSQEEVKSTAYHEAGHTLVALLNKDFRNVVHKVSIEPRGGALGITYMLPSREYLQDFKDSLLAQIAVFLGGRAAEELFLDQPSAGCRGDFQAATDVAFKMIAQFGMSDDFGKITYDVESLKLDSRAQKVAKKIVDQQYELVKQLLTENKDKIEKIVQMLFVKKTVYAAEICEALGIEGYLDLRIT